MNGCIYEGETDNDNQKHGQGRFTDNLGNIYEGFFKHDNITGRGLYKMTNGVVYVGNWKND